MCIDLSISHMIHYDYLKRIPLLTQCNGLTPFLSRTRVLSRVAVVCAHKPE